MPPTSARLIRGRGPDAGSPGLSHLHLRLDRRAEGIVISHRNICHFLRSADALYGFERSDVCFQGASVAFDLSMEIWIPYMVGATLVAEPAMIGDVETLPDVLNAAGITVLDTVPTLLSLMSRDVPSLP